MWQKTEYFYPKIKNEAKMSTLICHSTRSFNQRNKARRDFKKYTDWKGTNIYLYVWIKSKREISVKNFKFQNKRRKITRIDLQIIWSWFWKAQCKRVAITKKYSQEKQKKKKMPKNPPNQGLPWWSSGEDFTFHCRWCDFSPWLGS